MLGRAVDSLRALPAVDRDAIARTVSAAARLRAADLEPDEDDLAPYVPVRRRGMRTLSLVAAAVVVLAAGIGIVVGRGWRSPMSSKVVGAPRISAAPKASTIVPAAASVGDLDAAPVATQFVYDGPAHHVALVGDFNGWDEHATPLVREPRSALWSVTIPLQRGRHVYAFIVDSTWTTDRRAPVSRDPDFGVEGSVIIVGRP